uniref:ATP-binding protein n=1 Tax=Marinobacter sp. TaxID=50741 RepID=UPI003567D698
EAGSKAQDIYFFQQLAEAASRSNKRLIVVGVLHQSFGEYASRLSREARDEWTKIQGRFVDLPINTMGEEQVDLIARAIETSHADKGISALASDVFKIIKTNRPSASQDLSSKLERCWPLHPVVACLLGPISKRRFGQNQRSIFGFLNSLEPQGFQDYLKNTRLELHKLYSPANLWDYLRINLEPSILASPDGHRWSLAVEAVERCESLGGDALHVDAAKTIALIDLFKNKSGLVASFDFVQSCFLKNSKAEIQGVLDDLQKWSIIIFKKYLDSFTVYAGSDFDIDQALNEFDDGQKVDFIKLRKLAQLQPVLAKRYYHSTGSLCWFDIDIAPVAEAQERVTNFCPSGGAIGQFLLLIPTEGETVSQAGAICRVAADSAGTWPSLLGLAQNSWYIESLAKELIALERIRVERPELEGDAVGRREVDARILATSSVLEEELKKSLSGARWYGKGAEPHTVGHTGLSYKASMLAREIFPNAPRIHNELLNRIKPSSSAVAAQKALLRLMVSREGQERLGIDGFPAEGGLFESILKKTGIYRIDSSSGRYRFMSPVKNDEYKISPLWRAAEKFISNSPRNAISLKDIYDIWTAPKYGVRQGLLPILGVAFILANRNQVALYLDGIFRSSFDDYVVDCLTQDAQRLQLRWMNLPEVSRRILTGMADLVGEIDESGRQVELEPIEVAKRLVSIVDSLPKWTLRTMKISQNAKQVRDLFKQAHDPNKFLFDDIPSLFNGGSENIDLGSVGQIVSKVRDGIVGLRDAYPQMLQVLRKKMLSELNAEDDVVSLSALRDRAENIKEITGNFRLEAFITRLSNFQGQFDEVEGIASLAANKPPRDWIDRDIDQATIEIADLAQQFNRIEAFARVQGRTDKRHAVAVVVGLNGSPRPLSKEFDISAQEKKSVGELMVKIQGVIDGEEMSERLVLAAMAEISAKYMGF